MRHLKQIVYIIFLNKCLTSTTLIICKLDVALTHGKHCCFRCYYCLYHSPKPCFQLNQLRFNELLSTKICSDGHNIYINIYFDSHNDKHVYIKST